MKTTRTRKRQLSKPIKLNGIDEEVPQKRFKVPFLIFQNFISLFVYLFTYLFIYFYVLCVVPMQPFRVSFFMTWVSLILEFSLFLLAAFFLLLVWNGLTFLVCMNTVWLCWFNTLSLPNIECTFQTEVFLFSKVVCSSTVCKRIYVVGGDIFFYCQHFSRRFYFRLTTAKSFNKLFMVNTSLLLGMARDTRRNLRLLRRFIYVTIVWNISFTRKIWSGICENANSKNRRARKFTMIQLWLFMRFPAGLTMKQRLWYCINIYSIYLFLFYFILFISVFFFLTFVFTSTKLFD